VHHLLPPVKTLSIQLRPASHNCQLPICKYALYKRSFLVLRLLTVINFLSIPGVFCCFFSIYVMFLSYVCTFSISSCHVVLKVYLLTLKCCWSRVLFRIFHISSTEYIHFISVYTGISPINEVLNLRKLRFVQSLCTDSHIVHSLFYIVLSTPLAVQSNECVCVHSA